MEFIDAGSRAAVCRSGEKLSRNLRRRKGKVVAEVQGEGAWVGNGIRRLRRPGMEAAGNDEGRAVIVSCDCASAMIISSDCASSVYAVRGIFITYMMYVEWVVSPPTRNQ
jgi:hypothetical protein